MCYIPLLIDKAITKITISSCIGLLRTSDGKYVGGAINTDLTQYISATYVYKSQGIIYIDLKKSGGWGMTNNIPLCGQVKLTYTLS